MASPKINCAYSRIAKLTELLPNPKNPNRHPEKQIELLREIIKRQGWRLPITVSKRSGYIVRGHGKYLAACNATWPEVPIDEQDYASEAEEYADLIADNQIAELSEISTKELTELLIDLKEIDETLLEFTGFNSKELEKLLADIDPDSLGAGSPPGDLVKITISITGEAWKADRDSILNYLEDLKTTYTEKEVRINISE